MSVMGDKKESSSVSFSWMFGHLFTRSIRGAVWLLEVVPFRAIDVSHEMLSLTGYEIFVLAAYFVYKV